MVYPYSLEAFIFYSRYLKVEVYTERLIIQSKFSDPRKFALRFQYLEIKGVGIKIGNVSMFSDIGGDTLRNP